MLVEPPFVSRETEERLRAYMALLKKWNERINLVSPKDMDNLWERHILDSLQLVPLVKGRRQFVDMGSGGGFPGIVVGIAADIPGVLIESDQRKSAFLREAARITGARLSVLPCRLDRVELEPAPVVTARALAPLEKLLEWARPLLEPDGVGLFLKGRQAEQEIEEAARTWRFDVRTRPSKTSPDGVILEVSNFNRAEG